MPVVVVQSLSKEYSGRQVLKDVNLEVQSGEIFAVVGPNGAGKTTLLRILDLLEEPTSGTVSIDGISIDYSSKDRTAVRRRIGMVFQQTVLFNTSVFDNVAYGLRVRGESRVDIERRVKAVLELVKLQGFEQKDALALSGGEAQRVALAQALVVEPELLLLDEPTANLDPRSVSVVEEALSRINREMGTTMIMTTHNISQAESLARRVAVLNEGRVEGVGTFREVFGRSTKAVQGFARLENVFYGVSRITAEGTSLIDIGDGLCVEAAFERVGHVTFHIPPEDIILSTRPLTSSARNNFEGSIVQVVDMGPVVKLKVRSGRDFIVQITKRSFGEMQLNIGSRVFIAFKASSVQTN
jgi:molybdopterin-binding protein